MSVKIVRLKKETKKDSIVNRAKESDGPVMFFALFTGIMAISYLIMSIKTPTLDGYLDPEYFCLALFFLALSSLAGGAGHYISNNQKIKFITLGFLIAGGLSIILAIGYWITCG